MDPLGVAQAILALTLFPGGALPAALTWVASRAAGARGWAPGASEIAALTLLDGAVALAPLPGSPVAVLPPSVGAAPNLAVTVVLLGGVAALARPAGWDRARAVALASVAVGAAALAAGAATLSLPAIVAAPGGAMLAARVAAAVALLLGAVVVTQNATLSTPGRAALLAGVSLIAGALVLPAGVQGWQAALADAAVALAALSVAAVALRWTAGLRWLAARAAPLAAACCAAAITAAALAARV